MIESANQYIRQVVKEDLQPLRNCTFILMSS